MSEITEKRQDQIIRIADARARITNFIHVNLAQAIPDLTFSELAYAMNELSLEYMHEELIEEIND